MTKSKHVKLSTEIEFPLLLAFIFMLCFCSSSAQKNIVALEIDQPEEVSAETVKNESELLTYIIQVQKPQGDSSTLQSGDYLHGYYHSLLPESAKTPNRENLVYSYRNVIAGFAAKLTAEEAKALEEKEEIVSARPERILSLHTTHTPAFLGLQQGLGLWKGSNYGRGIIIGVLDTGIYPSHPSFSDEGMPDPPAKWNGYCEFTGKKTCNNKLIGARNLVKNSTTDPPYDDAGHGTHTASTAAGRFVHGASFFGNAKGTAVGMAPDAHLAIYKVCISDGCAESAILAGMDAAVEDGVDVLSLSIGGGPQPFFLDTIALGAFGAVKKGIFVSCSAANAGPFYRTLANEAPWILTVGAGSTDRKISAAAKLGNGVEFHGETAFQPKDFAPDLLPLLYPGANGNDSQAFCAPGSLKNSDVKGKVVVCDQGGFIARLDKGKEVKNAGGAALILASAEPQGFTTSADGHVLPAVHVNYLSGLAIKKYLNSTSKPTAAIMFEGTIIGNLLSPGVAAFSSRGPSEASPGILKPDIIGPGLNILAAWPSFVDNNYPPFNMISGTSMSCPHLSGIAALLKNSHPDWSPAAIKSAIMTTADKVNHKGIPILDQRLQPADLFAIGAGHVNPLKANDPGLVYDIEPNDYIPYLCGLGYTDKQVGMIVQQKVRCSEVNIIPEAQLNYPSFSIILGSTSQSYTRTLTNVGPSNSTYTVAINQPPGVAISISPAELTFSKVKQKVTYSVEFKPEDKKGKSENTFVQGSLKWVSVPGTGSYSVSIPISVIFK